jgi:hypothetical protein
MINRNELELTERTRDAYLNLPRNLERKRERVRHYHDEGYAEITKPLVYESFHELLMKFKEDPNAKRVSLRLSSHNWRRTHASEFTDEIIREFAERANQSGFLYLSFTDFGECVFNRGIHLGNEIAFEPNPNGQGIVSAALNVPGTERNIYTWKGSNTPYLNIHAMYAPSVVLIAQTAK